jgi:hypothetical protein
MAAQQKNFRAGIAPKADWMHRQVPEARQEAKVGKSMGKPRPEPPVSRPAVKWQSGKGGR